MAPAAGNPIRRTTSATTPMAASPARNDGSRRAGSQNCRPDGRAIVRQRSLLTRAAMLCRMWLVGFE